VLELVELDVELDEDELLLDVDVDDVVASDDEELVLELVELLVEELVDEVVASEVEVVVASDVELDVLLDVEIDDDEELLDELLVELLDVVVVGGLLTVSTRSLTQLSTRPCSVEESFVNWQSFGLFASSFAKQPFVGSTPPVYLATALSRQAFVFGSVGFPGVWASW